MAELEIIDEIAQEIKKIRGVDLPVVCIKIIVLSYMMYCANTYDVKYKNEDGQTMRLNSGCIVLCQKGSGKSRTLKALKNIFSSVENERKYRYEQTKEMKNCKYDKLFTLVDIKDMEIDWSKYGENNDSNMKAVFLRYEIIDNPQ